MDPTPTEAATLKTLEDVCTWAGLQGAHGDFKTARGALYNTLGCDGTIHWRSIAMYSEPDWTTLINQVVLEQPGASASAPTTTKPLSPIQVGQAGIVG